MIHTEKETDELERGWGVLLGVIASLAIQGDTSI
jgi:hypothetical protein